MHAVRDASCPCRAGIPDLPGLERDGDDVHGRSYAAACAKLAHQLVQHAEMALPGHFVGVFVCWVDAAGAIKLVIATMVSARVRQSSRSFSGQVFQQAVEVFEPGVFDDDFAAAVVVFDLDLEAEGALETFLDFANIGINGWLGLNFFLC